MDLANLNLPRELGQHLTGMDNMFFQLEHPRRLMTICSVWFFDNHLDITIIYEALENLCAHYPRFCLIPKHGTQFETPIWSRPHDNWTFKNNVILHILQEPTTNCLQKYMAQQYATPFDFKKPLWQVHLITGLPGTRTAFLWKAHHSMSDGIGIMKAVLATTTSFDPLEVTKQQMEQLQRRQSKSSSGQRLYDYMQKEQKRHRRKKKDRHRRHGTCYERTVHKVNDFWHQVIFWLVWGWQMMVMVMQQVYHELWTMSLLVEPLLQQLRHLIYAPIRRILSQRKPTRQMFYDDDQTIDKLIAWTDDLALADIQKVQRSMGGGDQCTLNDVMLMVFVRTVRWYIQQQSHTHLEPSSDLALRIIIPLSFRLPTDYAMKNVVTGNMVGLNTGAADTTTAALLQQVHQRMMTVKRSVLPYAMYHIFIQIILRYCPFIMMPLSMQHWYTDLPHAIFTNILGPTTPICFGGQEMEGFHVLPPQAGKGSISVGLVSYCNKVNISMLTDNHPAYPDLANVLCKMFISEFKSVLAEVGETLGNDTPECGNSDSDSGSDDDDGAKQ